MSEAASETDPETLVNCEQQDSPAAGEEQTSSVALQDESTEDGGTTEKDVQAKVQSVFEQVRTRIRSQASKSSILELVQKIKERETEVLQENSSTDGTVSAEEEKEEEQKDGSQKELDLRLEMLRSSFEDKLEATKRDLRNEFDVQISLVRKDMQTYTDQALKDLEQKMQEWRSHGLQQTHPKTQAEGAAAEKKQKSLAAPSLALRRGKVLTRTMTTIIPKTSAPVLTGPRAKSEEILSISKGHSPQFMLRDQVFYLPEKKPYQSCNPLPPARPPMHQRKKPAQTKPKTGN